MQVDDGENGEGCLCSVPAIGRTVATFRSHGRLRNREPNCYRNDRPWGLVIGVGIAFGGQAQEGNRLGHLATGFVHCGGPFRDYLFTV
jgi:hypothetical protein